MYSKIIKTLIILLLPFLLMRNAFAIDREESILFASFINAVSEGVSGSNRGKVCALGYDEVVVAMEEKDSNLINLSSHPEKDISCKMVYIAKDKEKVSRDFIYKYNNKRIVTVSLLNNFNENGGMIFIQMGRRSFELSLNSKEIKKAGIKLEPIILELVINN